MPITALRVEPFKGWYQLRSQLDALRVDGEAVIVDLAEAGYHIQVAAGGLGVEYGAVVILVFFKAAEAALAAC